MGEQVIDKLNLFIRRSKRVLNVAHRPKKQEYWLMAKTVAIGMVLIGTLGFIITIIFSFIDTGTI
ncbi:protein translocase SEC61 complex subunit gamma [Candidatus Micrarchaeota archaeon]|nr:MAG: protein translocase SEC61 complex subunit gamma [Candidatus Micrarchaeota archaeon]